MSEDTQVTEPAPEQKQREIILGDRNPADDMPEDGEPF